MDDVKASHISPEVNKEFFNWCEEKYGSDLNGHVKVVNGKIHEYLAMKLDYSIPEKLRVDMQDYIKELITTFPEKLSENIKCPWTTRLFNINDKTKLLDKQQNQVIR